MSKSIYKFALLISFITFVICVVRGITLFTSATRSAIVFVGILFIIYILGNLLRLGLSSTAPTRNSEDD